MAATTLVAARVEPQLKEQAKEILAKADITESQLIRRVFEYVVLMGEVPEFVFVGEYGSPHVSRSADTSRDKFQRMSEWLAADPFNEYDFTSITDDALKQDRAQTMDESFGWKAGQ